MLLRTVAILLACLCALSVPAFADQTWLLASDIHVDPANHYPRPSRWGRDTDLVLFESALAQMRKAEPNPQVVLLSGDFFAHHMRADALPAMRFIAGSFNKAFPHARFLIALGNNDDPCGDYRTSENSAYLRNVAAIWAPLVDRDGAAPNFQRDFARGAYYVASLPGTHARAVILNSVYWSFRYQNACAKGPANPGADEFAWLEPTLHATPANQKNLVIMHIPPGPDAFSTALLHGAGIVPFLHAVDDARLRAILADPANHIVAAVAGHTHRNEVRPAGDVAVTVIASISPIFRADPRFFVARVGDDGAPHILKTYDFDESSQTWNESAGFTPFTGDRYARCVQSDLAPDSFAACAGIPNRRVWIPLVLLGVALLSLLGALVVARRRRAVV